MDTMKLSSPGNRLHNVTIKLEDFDSNTPIFDDLAEYFDAIGIHVCLDVMSCVDFTEFPFIFNYIRELKLSCGDCIEKMYFFAKVEYPRTGRFTKLHDETTKQFGELKKLTSKQSHLIFLDAQMSLKWTSNTTDLLPWKSFKTPK
ncbi:unnamed protein product [Ambrosiozyma monospora]|uniref:Unnamed protein product n=1 Tax=Ambrosiozyma monospora TaxID=43982 RepID=A0ACB5TBW4_AMBMO|nr:unnamed protein product [Ambrosiozyma monospora]